MDITAIRFPKQPEGMISFLDQEHMREVGGFHQSFPMYQETPLVSLKNLAGCLGVKSFYVKDESFRFGLNAFKVLGGSYAVGKYIAQKLGVSITQLPYERMVSDAVKEAVGDLTFVTATDGNHGRGVAWTARQLRQKAVVYMPQGSSRERLENIRAEGAEASILNLNYDETVRFAAQQAQKNHWIMVQDTSWPGYEAIPRWIIQGYGTMALEACQALPERPTHIFIQAGVGALAGAVTGVFANRYPDDKPTVIVVEPEQAACIFKSAQAADGKPRFVTGAMRTIMAGLACGEPCSIGWEVLKHYADFALVCTDETAARGMRILGAPLADDRRVISGESGAAGVGAAADIFLQPQNQKIREQLGLNEDSVILCFSTEGATDRKSYQEIVWNGKFANLMGGAGNAGK